MSNVPVTRGNNEIFGRFAQTYGVDPSGVSRILKNTAFKVADRNNPNLEVSDEQMVALLVVADKFRLNPFIREIYAFVDTHGKGITPVIPVDGWARIANEHPQYDGVEFRDAEKTVKIGNKEVPEWIEATVYRKDRSHPTTIREYFNECTRNTTPWGSHPARMLRHKAFIQSARIALGFGGVYDEDEAERISMARIVETPPSGMSASIDVTTETKALDVGADFQNLMVATGFSDQLANVDIYLQVCARHFGKSEEEVKAEICRRPDDFVKTFPAWLKSAEQQSKAQKEAGKAAPKGNKKSSPPPAAEDTGEVFICCPNRDGAERPAADCFACPETECPQGTTPKE